MSVILKKWEFFAYLCIHCFESLHNIIFETLICTSAVHEILHIFLRKNQDFFSIVILILHEIKKNHSKIKMQTFIKHMQYPSILLQHLDTIKLI